MIGAWLVHLYTASGLVLALLATRAVIDFNYRAAFFWLWLQVVIDATDGLLARRARVAERIPWFDGSKLDDVVDYLSLRLRSRIVRLARRARAWRVDDVGCGGDAACRVDMDSVGGTPRPPDHFFTGFPSSWNVVVFYLLVAGFSSS